MTTTETEPVTAPGRTWPRALVDVVAFAVMVGAACLALGPSYGGTRWLVAVIGGAVLGAAIGSGAALARWPVSITVVAAAVAYLLFGAALATPSTAVAGVMPGLDSLRLLAIGVVAGWKQLLTVAGPVGDAGALLVPAFLLPLVAAVVGTSLAGRLRRPLWSLAVPVAVFVAAALFGTSTPHLPVIAGTVAGVAALAWGAWRVGGFGSVGLDVRRPASAVLLVAGAVAAALFAAPLAAPATPRLALRDSVQPPFDPQDYLSPLSAFRSDVLGAAKTDMITVTGLPKGGRLRVATMDQYTGVYYDVSTLDGAFVPVGQQISTGATGTPVKLSVQVDHYSGVWLPDIGSLQSVSFGGAHAAALTDSLRYSRATGTAVATDGLAAGDSYRLSAIVPATPAKSVLSGLRRGPAPLDQGARVPDALKSAAATWTDGKQTDYDKVEAIRDQLASRGLLDHGQTGDSPSGHGYDRLLRLMTDKKMVGDQEQFAPAMALMVQSLGIPARVVMGFVPPKNYAGTGPVTLTGAQMSAWVEVDFDKVGWVPFDPTPDESRVHQQTTPKPKTAPRKQVLQPPPPPRVPQNVSATDAQKTASKDKQDTKKNTAHAESGSRALVWATAGVGVPLVLFGAPIAMILLLKRRRRNRRRRASLTARQVAGGWEQLVDGAVDLGAGVPGRLTRTESAAVIDTHFGASTATIARAADARVFGPGEPTPDDAQRFWAEVDAALSGMNGTTTAWRRLRAKLSTASLRRGGEQ